MSSEEREIIRDLREQIDELREQLAEKQNTCTDLMQSRVLFDSLVRSMPQHLFCKDMQGRFIFGNQQFCEDKGLSLDELVGKTDFDIHPSDAAEEYRRADREVMTTGIPIDLVEKHITKDGDTRYVQVIKTPIFDEQGNTTGILGMFWDVTQNKRVEKELAAINRKLEMQVRDRTRKLQERTTELEGIATQLLELDELKSSFLTTVSHDLRTPLTSMRGFTSQVKKNFDRYFLDQSGQEPKLAKQGRRISENLGIIDEEGRRLTRLINDFLDLSKIEAGRINWKDEHTTPGALVPMTLDAMEYQAESRPDVELVVQVADDLPDIFVDPDRMVQVLVNLMDNAFKYTTQGSVTLGMNISDDNMIHIAVTDTGGGIPLEESELVFDKFHQVDRGDTLQNATAKSTGLGLSICREIVEHYLGRIWCESTPGVGTTFHIKLPPSHA